MQCVKAALSLSVVLAVCSMNALGQDAPSSPTKSAGVFHPPGMTDKAKSNAAAYPWAAAARQKIIDAAAAWTAMPDDDLWDLIFGATITRSWMVWSDGFCPACKKDVKMYDWIMDPWSLPWKTQCPHCKEIFPKNDFRAFYRSGLDEQGIFQPARADRALLFNAEHPDPNDPLRGFGVDDGEGYVDNDGHRWRFIGAYLIYGQWKKWIVSGVTALSEACLVTGEPVYARKAAILLDRIADVFPSYDFFSQGLVYEGRSGGPTRGQVSTWHDACREIHELVMGYDCIFETAKAQEADLTAFLSRKAQEHKLDNPKATWVDIQRNIEERIFRETLTHRDRIESNYPTTDNSIAAIKTVLDWPRNRDEVMGLLDGILDKSNAVDGLSGEKGLAGYSIIAPNSVSEILGEFSRIEPGILQTIYERHPRLRDCFRFHIDTWHAEKFYPSCGDSGTFGTQIPSYAGVSFNKSPGTAPSMYTFMWDLFTVTQDPAFVQVLYASNEHKADGLPYDLFADDPAGFQARVQSVIDKNGAAITPKSVNKQQWRLALLRSGSGENERTLWIDYDAGERHSHADGMNIGLFAKGLDLIPEFGYPPVGYGGWQSQKAQWYMRTAAHATVEVDGKNQHRINSGTTTLWADGKEFHAIRCSDPAMIGGTRYERTVAMIDVSDKDSYVLDTFIVSGGTDHAKFFHSFFGTMETKGLALENAPDYDNATEMRNFRQDPKPPQGWYADWAIEDRYKYLPEPRNIHLRYTDLTYGASAWVMEGWIDVQLYGGSGGTYIPRIMTRRTSPDGQPLTSTFVDLIEPYENESNLGEPLRIALSNPDGTPSPDTAVGIEIPCRDGRRHLCIMPDISVMADAADGKDQMRVLGRLGFVSVGASGPDRIVLCNGTRLDIGGTSLKMKQETEFVEVALDGSGARIESGNAEDVESITRGEEHLAIARQ